MTIFHTEHTGRMHSRGAGDLQGPVLESECMVAYSDDIDSVGNQQRLLNMGSS
jgi:hypothetical protein